MIPKHIVVLAFFAAGTAWSAQLTGPIPDDLRREVTSRATKACEALEPLYKQFHTHPELSSREEKTSERVAHELEQLGFEVTRRLGGYGVVGVLKNGILWFLA